MCAKSVHEHVYERQVQRLSLYILYPRRDSRQRGVPCLELKKQRSVGALWKAVVESCCILAVLISRKQPDREYSYSVFSVYTMRARENQTNLISTIGNTLTTRPLDVKCSTPKLIYLMFSIVLSPRVICYLV